MIWVGLEWGAPMACGAACIAIHKFAVQLVSNRLTVRGYRSNANGLMRALVFLLLAHLIEIALFAGAIFLLDRAIPGASLTGAFQGSIEDYLYFSSTTYSSLGFGDIVPNGGLRLLVGVEALVGLIMIAWTAAFLFAETDQQGRGS
ncbi:MAG: potassium channel family protein [Pseudomonadota bacterium]